MHPADVLYPILSLTSAAIIMLLFIICCWKCMWYQRIRQAYWRRVHARKSRDVVFMTNDEEKSVCNLLKHIYNPGGPNPALLNTPEHFYDESLTRSPSIPDSDLSFAIQMESSKNVKFTDNDSDDNHESCLYIPMDMVEYRHGNCRLTSKLRRMHQETCSIIPPTPPHLLLDSPENSTYISPVHIPVARCSPYRMCGTVGEPPGQGKSTTVGALSSGSSQKKSHPEVPSGSLLHCSSSVSARTARLSRSCEDLFHGGWWKSPVFSRRDSFHDEDIRQRITRPLLTAAKYPSDCSSLYVDMQLRTALRSGGSGIRRSRTMTRPFGRSERHCKAYDSLCLSVWCPEQHLTGDVQLTPALRPIPTQCSIPHYVNFSGFLPNQYTF